MLAAEYVAAPGRNAVQFVILSWVIAYNPCRSNNDNWARLCGCHLPNPTPNPHCLFLYVLLGLKRSLVLTF